MTAAALPSRAPLTIAELAARWSYSEDTRYCTLQTQALCLGQGCDVPDQGSQRMSVPDYAPRAFGGATLRGDDVTKFVHMDEAGISHGEPYCAQVGVIVTADAQWKQVERRIAEVLADLVPYKHSKGYIFHAKEIFHGTDSYYTRERFPDPQMRAAVVRRVASIATEFELPVLIGWLTKANFPQALKLSRKRASAHFHDLAFMRCLMMTEYYMRYHTPKDEVAVLYVEKNDAEESLTATLLGLDISGMIGELPSFRNIAAVQRIIETPSFVPKTRSSLLQIADACAFSFLRQKRGLSFGDFLMEGIEKVVVEDEYVPKRR